MKNSLKQIVIHYMEENVRRGDYEWAGRIARALHEQTGHKESVIERHGLRKLREEGVLEVDYAQVDGSGPKCARYRLAEELQWGKLEPEITYPKDFLKLKQEALIK